MIAPLPLVRGPTPLRPLALPGTTDRLWIKDESGAGDLGGGNKVRKLAYLLAGALDRGRTDVVTWGAVGSHHVLATAEYGARYGLRTHAVLVPQPDHDHVHRVAGASHAALASGWAAPRKRDLPVALAALWARVVRETGRRPARFPAGGSNRLGALGWVDGGRELAGQLAALGRDAPKRVVVAAGSGGTAAGLLAGLAAAGFSGELVAVRVTPAVMVSAPKIAALAAAASGGRTSGRVRLDVDARWLGAGYGCNEPRAELASAAAAREGVTTDPTYTAKALAAAWASARDGVATVYVHTLGAPEPGPAVDLPDTLAALLTATTRR